MLNLQNIDWVQLATKQVDAPFKPVIIDDLDTSNFASEFTEMTPDCSPAATPAIESISSSPSDHPFKVKFISIIP